MKKYYLPTQILPDKQFIMISKISFMRYFIARDFILNVFSIEEAIDAVIDNYLEFEEALLKCSITKAIRTHLDREEFNNYRRLFNRLLINLLSTCGAYINVLKVTTSNILPGNNISFDLTNECKKEFDSNLAYRILQKLRNHVLHFGWPLDSISFDMRRVNENLRYNIIPRVTIQHLAKNPKFPKHLLGELKQRETKYGIDIRPLVKEYVESIGRIHIHFREAINNKFLESENSILTSISKFKKKYPKAIVEGLVLVEEDGRCRSRAYKITNKLSNN